MMPLGTHLSGTCPQMGALIHTDSGLIHTWSREEMAGIARGFREGDAYSV